MRRIKVRFNLGRGKNYMKWKVEYSKGVSEYYDPKEVQLMMDNCVLKNHKGTSKKIYEGSNKTVCAWVLCETIKLLDKEINMSYLNGDRIQYNPKIKPNWVIIDDIVDDVHFEKIVSFENKLFNIFVSEEDMKSFGDWCRNGVLNTEYGVEKLDEHLEQWKQLKKK